MSKRTAAAALLLQLLLPVPTIKSARAAAFLCSACLHPARAVVLVPCSYEVVAQIDGSGLLKGVE